MKMAYYQINHRTIIDTLELCIAGVEFIFEVNCKKTAKINAKMTAIDEVHSRILLEVPLLTMKALFSIELDGNSG